MSFRFVGSLADAARDIAVGAVASTCPEEMAAFLHFSRFLESLCLKDGAALFSDDVGDAVHWHSTMMGGQYR